MPLKQIGVSDRDLSTVQDNVGAAITTLEVAPFSNGRLITGVSLTSGQDNLVAHKLGRALAGWTLNGINVNATVWSPASSSLGNASSNAQYLNLRCSTSCTVAVWVS